MSNATNRVRSTLKLSSGIPLKDRDQYFPEDFISDMDYLDGKRGDVWNLILAAVPAIQMSTGVITLVSGSNISYTEATGWCKDSKGIIREIIVPAAASFAPSLALGNGTYYVKANYSETDSGATRVKVYDPSSYTPFTIDAATVTINKTVPTADELCLGAFLVSGGIIVSLDTTLRSPDAKFRTGVIQVEDASILLQHIDPGVFGSLVKKLTNFRGAYARLYPVSTDSSNRQGTLYLFDVEAVTAAGIAQTIEKQEQKYPRSRVDQAQQSDLTGSYSTLTSLSEATADKVPFTASATLLFAANHQRVGLYIKTVGSGYTHLRVALHDSGNNLLNSVDIPIADITAVGANAWIYADLPYILTPGDSYHYHVYMVGFTSGTSCAIAKSAGNLIAFREMYRPDSGKYGGASEADVVIVKDKAGTRWAAANGSTVDDIVSPGDGYSALTAQDIMAVDFSNPATWAAWGYNNFIGIDMVNGRLKMPSGIDVRKYFAEFNTFLSFDEVDARSILRHNRTIPLEDELNWITTSLLAGQDSRYTESQTTGTGTSEFPQYITYARTGEDERIRLEITWDTDETSLTYGMPTVIVYQISHDAGASYYTLATETITYSAGTRTGNTWS